jgi:predicted amidophosphoribosyltransferase
MHRIIEMLCEKNPNLVNGAKMLFRIKQKNSFCRGAKRSYLDIYFDTYVNYLHPIANNRFILLDDVLTTGTTLAACRAILLELGADSVTCLALAYTKLVFEKPEKYF